MKSQNRRRDRQRAALVQPEPLSIALPQIERGEVAISAEHETPSPIGETEAAGSNRNLPSSEKTVLGVS
jgi:hypothetical protein